MWVFVGCVISLLNVDHLVWGAGVSTGREVDSQRSRLTEGKHLRLKSPLLIYNLENEESHQDISRGYGKERSTSQYNLQVKKIGR